MPPASGSALALLAAAAILSGCATLPPGSSYPKQASAAFAQPEETQLGRQFADVARDRQGSSAFRILSIGAEGFAARMQMIDAAEQSLDLQYYIFRGDTTGRLLTHALLRAADRGVRLRVLLDDGDTLAGDEQILVRSRHILRSRSGSSTRSSIAATATSCAQSSSCSPLRVSTTACTTSCSLPTTRVRSSAAAMSATSTFRSPRTPNSPTTISSSGGPAVQKLSRTFDEYWNNALAIPVEALAGGKPTEAALVAHRALLAEQWQQAQSDDVSYVKLAKSGAPRAGMIEGRLPLVWSTAQVLSDSPDKRSVEHGSMIGRLMYEPIAEAVKAVNSELLLVTPYFIPTAEEMKLLTDLRLRDVRVRILTNSL